MPTIAELLGLQLEKPCDGISFLPTLLGKPTDQKQHETMYWELSDKNRAQAVLKSPWKAVRTGVGLKPDVPWELYNLESDPQEKMNIAGDHPDIVKQLDEVAKQSHWHPIVNEWDFIDSRLAKKSKDQAE
jgi:arylsulfatase A-like enzyme